MSLKQFKDGFANGFKDFSHSISKAVSTTLLVLTYIIGVGIVAVAAKVARKKFLPMHKQESYWVVRNLGKQKIEEYKRSF